MTRDFGFSFGQVKGEATRRMRDMCETKSKTETESGSGSQAALNDVADVFPWHFLKVYCTFFMLMSTTATATAATKYCLNNENSATSFGRSFVNVLAGPKAKTRLHSVNCCGQSSHCLCQCVCACVCLC